MNHNKYPLHKTLIQQIKKCTLNDDNCEIDWTLLLQKVSATYEEYEKEISVTHRSLHLMSHEILNLNESIIQNDKLASLGVLTAGVAHEINNPINFISTSILPLKNDIKDLVQVLKKYSFIDIKNAEQEIIKIQAYINEINMPYILDEINLLFHSIDEGIKRTLNIVKDLKTFSRLDENDIKPVNINDAINTTLNLLIHSYKDRINVIKNYGEINPIDCFPGKINQVLMNLLSNAFESIKDTGSIEISTYGNEKNTTICIKDSGSGIPKNIQSRIFEPFFTTKPVGSGTGLGLSITYTIIQEHKGTIEFKTQPDQGTEFIVTLPNNQML